MKIWSTICFKRRTRFSLFLLLVLPIAVFYLMEWFTHNPLATMRPRIQFLNILFFALVTLLFLFLFKRAKFALWIEAILFAVVGLANYFVLEFRSTPIMPWDILSLKTAASVADNYSYQLDAHGWRILLLFLLVLILSSFCHLTIKPLKLRLLGVLTSLLLLAGFVRYTQSNDCLYRFRLYDKLFTPTTMTYKDGTVVAFCMQLKYLFVEKPAGYSPQKAEQILADHTNLPTALPDTSQASTTPPNIIVIMNEAFSDLRVLGDFSTNEEVIPFVHSLLQGAENVQSGYLGVSVLGGNTANTEFEFLTGQTMAFLPQGSVPYQQYIKQETFSLASWLKALGYTTIALHPYHASGWQRDLVYPHLGFDRFLSLADFSGAKMIRKYVSDESHYEKIVSLYEKKEEGVPLFLFNVTMQNHSSYTETYPDFTPNIQVEGSDHPGLSQYLSLLQISDQDIKNLVNYFQQQEEPTILLFFGDHQPTDSVVKDIYRLNGKDLNNMDSALPSERYQVPFFLWANFDIPEKRNYQSSPNFLGTLTLEAAGLPLSPFHQFLQKLAQRYPKISSVTVEDASGTAYAVSDLGQNLNDYAILQYYYLMEKGKLNEE